MASEFVSLSRLLPTYTQCHNYLQSDLPAGYNAFPNQKPIEGWNTKVEERVVTPRGEINSVEYFNANDVYGGAPNMKPLAFRQTHEDTNKHLTVNTYLHKGGAGSELLIGKPNEYVDHILVRSHARLGCSFETIEFDLNLSRVVHIPEVAQLSPSGKLIIKREGGKVRIYFWSDKFPQERELDEPAAETVCQGLDMDFGFGIPSKGKSEAISIRMGNVSIMASIPDIRTLDSDKVWKAFTGTDEANPFIFPVEVNIAQ